MRATRSRTSTVLAGIALVSVLGTGPRASADIAAATATATASGSFVAVDTRSAFAFTTPLATDDGSPLALSDYAMGRDLVTNDDYAAFCLATGHATPLGWSGGGVPLGLGAHPVVQVSRDDAEAYAAWRTSLTSGWTIRLPTEAEWENAARGSGRTVFPWGNSADVVYDPASGRIEGPLDFDGVVAADYLRMYGADTVAMDLRDGEEEPVVLEDLLSETSDGAVAGWSLDSGASGFVHTDLYARSLAVLGYTTAVGSFPASPSGLDDMAGNVWEWTGSSRALGSGTTAAPVRGGAWSADLAACTTSYRGETRDPAQTFNDVGFRLVAAPVTQDIAASEATTAVYAE